MQKTKTKKCFSIEEKEKMKIMLGEILREHRKSLKMDYKQVRAEILISQPTLSRIERGEQFPDLYTLIELSVCFKKNLLRYSYFYIENVIKRDKAFEDFFTPTNIFD